MGNYSLVDFVMTKKYMTIKSTGRTAYSIFSNALLRFEVEEMFCMLCNNLGPIDKFCRTCMKEMGVYYCNVCKFIDNDPNKTIYHCTDCGICRIGKGLDIDYFHCMKVCIFH